MTALTCNRPEGATQLHRVVAVEDVAGERQVLERHLSCRDANELFITDVSVRAAKQRRGFDDSDVVGSPFSRLTTRDTKQFTFSNRSAASALWHCSKKHAHCTIQAAAKPERIEHWSTFGGHLQLVAQAEQAHELDHNLRVVVVA